MFFKILIVLLLATVIWALASGLIFLMRDKGQSDRTVKALSWRIGLSILVFALIMLGYALGWIEPNVRPGME